MEETAAEPSLTIERDSEPIAGRLGLPDGRALRFEGYLELVGLLEKGRKPSLEVGAERPVGPRSEAG